MCGDRCRAPGLEPGEHCPFGEGSQPGGRVVEIGEGLQQRCRRIVTALHGEGTLGRRREEGRHVEQLGDPILQPESPEPCSSEHDGVQVLARAAQPGLDIAPDLHDGQVGTQGQQLRSPAWRTGADPGANGQPGQREAVAAAQGVRRVLAERDGAELQSGSWGGGQVLEGVDGDVAVARDDGCTDGADEDPGAAEAGQRGVGDVAVRGDADQLHLVAAGAQRVGDVPGLRPGER